jgi:hypothetical protein
MHKNKGLTDFFLENCLRVQFVVFIWFFKDDEDPQGKILFPVQRVSGRDLGENRLLAEFQPRGISNPAKWPLDRSGVVRQFELCGGERPLLAQVARSSGHLGRVG